MLLFFFSFSFYFYFFRVYDNASLRHVWQVGPLPLKHDGSLNPSTVYALGEAAVDFDIAPAVNVAEMQVNTMNATINKDQSVLVNCTRLNQNTNRTIIGETTKVSEVKFHLRRKLKLNNNLLPTFRLAPINYRKRLNGLL